MGQMTFHKIVQHKMLKKSSWGLQLCNWKLLDHHMEKLWTCKVATIVCFLRDLGSKYGYWRVGFPWGNNPTMCSLANLTLKHDSLGKLVIWLKPMFPSRSLTPKHDSLGKFGYSPKTHVFPRQLNRGYNLVPFPWGTWLQLSFNPFLSRKVILWIN
jgi:hypothetical protein